MTRDQKIRRGLAALNGCDAVVDISDHILMTGRPGNAQMPSLDQMRYNCECNICKQVYEPGFNGVTDIKNDWAVLHGYNSYEEMKSRGSSD